LGAAYLALKRQANQITPFQGEEGTSPSPTYETEFCEALLEIFRGHGSVRQQGSTFLGVVARARIVLT